MCSTHVNPSSPRFCSFRLNKSSARASPQHCSSFIFRCLFLWSWWVHWILIGFVPMIWILLLLVPTQSSCWEERQWAACDHYDRRFVADPSTKYCDTLTAFPLFYHHPISPSRKRLKSVQWLGTISSMITPEIEHFSRSITICSHFLCGSLHRLVLDSRVRFLLFFPNLKTIAGVSLGIFHTMPWKLVPSYGKSSRRKIVDMLCEEFWETQKTMAVAGKSCNHDFLIKCQQFPLQPQLVNLLVNSWCMKELQEV